MMDINIIRILSAFLSGTLLSYSGTLIQGVTQNELAGPSTLGINAFVVILIMAAHLINISFGHLFHLEYISLLLLFLFCLPTFLILRKKRKKIIYSNKHISNINFYILIGLCFNLFVSALFAILHFLLMSLNMEFPTEIWYGNFRFTSLPSLIILSLTFVFVFSIGYKLSKKLRIMSFGSDFAISQNIDVNYVQFMAVSLSVLAVGVVTSLFGVFAFVCLIFPHLLRSFNAMQRNISHELNYGSLISGVIFSIIDFLCSIFDFYGAEFPVGMISATFGALLLLIILLRKSLQKI